MKAGTAATLGRALLLLGGMLIAVCGRAAFRSARSAANGLYPPRQPVPDLETLGFGNEVEAASFVTSDGSPIRGWYIPSQNRAAVLLAHGYGANRCALLFEARVLAGRGYGVLLFDWRCHGESGGEMVTWGDRERQDLAAALDFLSGRLDVDGHRIGAVGFSMGGIAVGGLAGADRRLAAIVLTGTASSLAAAIREDYRKWGWLSAAPALWALRRKGIDVDALRLTDTLRSVSPRPVLLINGSEDDIRMEDEARLFQAISHPKDYWIVPGAGHGEYATAAPEEYSARLTAFFDASLLRSEDTSAEVSGG